MSISPVSFKGLVSVRTRIDENNVKTEHFRTTKKQDAELLRAFVENTKEIEHHKHQTAYNPKSREYGNLENIYGKHTKLFHSTLESVIGKKIEQPSLGDKKSLYLGGSISSNYCPDKYNSSYNKIFYYDNVFINKCPNSNVVVDLMNPEERKEAAQEVLSQIEKRIFNLTGQKEKAIAKPINFKNDIDAPANTERLLNKVLQVLDKGITGFNPLKAKESQEIASSQATYNAFINSLGKVIGQDLTYCDLNKIEKLSEQDKNNMRTAIFIMDNVLQLENTING